MYPCVPRWTYLSTFAGQEHEMGLASELTSFPMKETWGVMFVPKG
jgi:hypothetical protein